MNYSFIKDFKKSREHRIGASEISMCIPSPELSSESLKAYTQRCIVSYIDIYRKCKKNMKDIKIFELKVEELSDLFSFFCNAAASKGIDIQSCAEEEFVSDSVKPGNCIDSKLVFGLTGKAIDYKKDKNQRDKCLCVESTDIGMYNSCPHNCLYCYANSDFKRSKTNHCSHDPENTQLI